MEILQNILSSLWFIFLLVSFFGLSIFVHELGHFLGARWCGMVVEVFAIGFGPAIWQFRRNGVLYKVGCIPLGGYVALPQLDPTGMSRIQGETGDPAHDLPAISAWKKILVSVAGAVGNILFAILLAWMVYWWGMPAGPSERSSMVGYVDTDSAAYAAGLRIGDTIVSVSGKPTATWTDVRMEAAYHQAVDLAVRTRDGEERMLHLPTARGSMGEQHVPGVDGPSLCMVLRADSDMAAYQAGMRPGDLIVGFAGEEIFSRTHLIKLVSSHEGEEVPVVVKRKVGAREETLTLSLVPERDEALGIVRIGVEFNLAAVEHDTVVHPSPWSQIRGHATAIFRFLGALTSPKQARAASNAVGGPVAILVSYWYIVKTSPMLALWFTGFLNVNLAILNLLPIPVLDGGHICFSLIELVRRRPVPPRLVNAVVNVFAVLLISLIVVLSVRDVDRFTPVGRLVRGLFGGGGAEAPVPAQTQPVEPAK